MGVYKREGTSPSEAWNELIRRVNKLVPDCGLTPLPEVSPNHRWSKSDIKAAQDKLIELCNTNNFSAIPPLWKQSIIDELIKAINQGSCCSCPPEPKPLHPEASVGASGFDTTFPFYQIELGYTATSRGTRVFREYFFPTLRDLISYTTSIFKEGKRQQNRFWIITRFFDVGIRFGAELGPIGNCGSFLPGIGILNLSGNFVLNSGLVDGKVSNLAPWLMMTGIQRDSDNALVFGMCQGKAETVLEIKGVPPWSTLIGVNEQDVCGLCEGEKGFGLGKPC